LGELGSRLGLAVETLEEDRIPGYFRVRGFQGDKSAQPWVLGPIDNAHGAFAELAEDFILAEFA
jgi:hypothetical protein